MLVGAIKQFVRQKTIRQENYSKLEGSVHLEGTIVRDVVNLQKEVERLEETAIGKALQWHQQFMKSKGNVRYVNRSQYVVEMKAHISDRIHRSNG
ncbi:hypothetical protein J1N35_027839 [Gossypium stocksii]|uniref:Uncharacterized protein n=1 Tax=Gossypium stocksii TaxID=47602 RepID=A0A9D3ZZZ6_9ROSI|nr:hypothetical protein J1N35_027839 [Gossypium stocksii]